MLDASNVVSYYIIFVKAYWAAFYKLRIFFRGPPTLGPVHCQWPLDIILSSPSSMDIMSLGIVTGSSDIINSAIGPGRLDHIADSG